MLKKIFNKKPSFRFNEQKNTACFTCKHILEDKQDILYVSHDVDNNWQFLCGNDSHTVQDAKIISLEEITIIDQTVNDLYEMPTGIFAERIKTGDKWKPYKLK